MSNSIWKMPDQKLEENKLIFAQRTRVGRAYRGRCHKKIIVFDEIKQLIKGTTNDK